MSLQTTRAGIPIACNPQVFSKAELEAHIALALDLLFRLPIRRQELPDGFLFEYQGREDLFLKAAQFIYNEHRCCPWESFALEMDPFAAGTDGTIRLRYLGGAEGKAYIAEALKQLAAAADAPDAQKRLQNAARDSSWITPENRAEFYEKVSARPTDE